MTEAITTPLVYGAHAHPANINDPATEETGL